MSSGSDGGASGERTSRLGVEEVGEVGEVGEVSTASVRAVVAAARGIPNPLVLIDGPSGAGKSTLADAVRRAWPAPSPQLVRLDDVYPGWHGLERASRQLARSLVARLDRGSVGTWQRWDWRAGRPAAIENVRPGGSLIIEGCGAFATGAPDRPAVRVWVGAADGVRRRRALDRDAGAFDSYWDVWERQWRRYVQRTDPARSADLVLLATARGIEPGRVDRAAHVHGGTSGTNVDA